MFTITFVNVCTPRRQRCEPFVRARFVYNNIRKRLHTPRRQRCEPFVRDRFVYNNIRKRLQ